MQSHGSNGYAREQKSIFEDLLNSWIKRPKKQAEQEEVKTMEDNFPSSNPMYKATSKPFTTKDREAFYRDLIKTDVDR